MINLKRFLDYYRVQRLPNVINTRFGFVSLQMFVLIFIVNIQIVGQGGAFIDNASLFVFSIMIMSQLYLRTSSEINHATLHPLKKSEKLIHNLIYIIIGIIALWIFLILIFTLILLVVFIFSPGSVSSSNEGIETVTIKSFYYYSWMLSYGGFLHMLTHIRKTKTLRIVYVLGTIGYIILNTITLSILNNKLTFKGSIGTLFDASSSHSLFHYILSGILILSFVGAIIWSIMNVKPKKKINYR